MYDDPVEHAPSPPDAPSTARPHVLLAEDDDDFRTLLAAVLRRDGYAVTAVASGKALLEAARGIGDRREPPPALAISDERMPGGLTGLNAFRALRGDGLTMPVILITAFGDDDLIDKAAETGATVMRKPFDVTDLRTLVRYLITVDGTASPRMTCTACGAIGDVGWLDETAEVVLCRECRDLSDQLEPADLG